MWVYHREDYGLLDKQFFNLEYPIEVSDFTEPYETYGDVVYPHEYNLIGKALYFKRNIKRAFVRYYTGD